MRRIVCVFTYWIFNEMRLLLVSLIFKGKKEEKKNWNVLFWELDYRELYEKEIPLCVKILRERENEKRKKATALVSPQSAVYPAEVRCVWGVVVCSVQFQAVTDGNFVRNHWAAANSTLEIQQVTVGVLCRILPVRTSHQLLFSLTYSDSHALDQILFARI